MVEILLNRRSSPRRRSNTEATVLLSVGSAAEALIIDEGEDGLRLGFNRDVSLPPRFHVIRAPGSPSLLVQLVWQRGSTAGVRIVRE